MQETSCGQASLLDDFDVAGYLAGIFGEYIKGIILAYARPRLPAPLAAEIVASHFQRVYGLEYNASRLDLLEHDSGYVLARDQQWVLEDGVRTKYDRYHDTYNTTQAYCLAYNYKHCRYVHSGFFLYKDWDSQTAILMYQVLSKRYFCDYDTRESWPSHQRRRPSTTQFTTATSHIHSVAIFQF